MSGLLLCVLVTMVATGAQAVSLPLAASGPPPQHPGEEPKPCLVPRYFTLEQVDLAVTVEDGKLKVEQETWVGAWDSITEQESLRKDINYENGTQDYSKIIAFYKEGVRYDIEKRGEETVCHKEDIEGKKFPDQYTFPKDAKFIGESTLGDRDLVVNNWFSLSEQGTKHTVRTYTKEECVPVGLLYRKYDLETGAEVEVRDSRMFNIELGICDREKYFKVPDVCEPGRALKQPTATMLKWRKFRE